MKQSYLVLLLVSALCLCLASAEVQVATKSNFDQIVSGDLVLVKFYAPWCGHCKTLAPEYEKASAMLQGVATLAEVDCTQEKDLAARFEIRGFPTLKVFRNGQAEEYKGPRTAGGITAHMKAQVGPAVTTVTTEAQLTDMKAEGIPLCVIKTTSADSDLAKTMAAVAGAQRVRFNFALVTDASLSPEDAMESVTVYRHATERDSYKGSTPVTIESAKAFLADAQLDFFGELGQETFEVYMEANGVKPLGWLFVDKNTPESLKAAVTEVAVKHRSDVLMSWIDGDKYAQVSRQLAVPEGTKFPVLVLDFQRRHHVMPLDVAVTAQSVDDFVSKYVRGETTQTVMSESVPAQETVAGLTTLVGSTVDKYTDGTRNAFILFYAPWCGHCKKLHPDYEKMARELEKEDVVIAKLDAVANDFDRDTFTVNGFPTMYFIPAGGKPQVYDGGRTAEAMKEYIVKHMVSGTAKPAVEDDEDL